ncbi:MAG: hypothetical protein A3E01_08605 [Gammaproteobacteria bacterium RIFCSPHIGHO2_12_FULL_63_22]|nr:MAG: hypothetical protein A3E01_08605 [Gammaproteobacteria bacterium RIFCSPHIGHO2_12_FULL_63_22]
MDTFVFIAALGLGVAVMAWFVLNEARGLDGTFGVFALKGGETADLKEEAAEAGRYRIRPRLAPVRRAGLQAPPTEKSYRMKEAARPSRREETDDAADEF